MAVCPQTWRESVGWIVSCSRRERRRSPVIYLTLRKLAGFRTGNHSLSTLTEGIIFDKNQWANRVDLINSYDQDNREVQL